MSKIKILSKLLTDKIAAGEVVERPAAVVKELLENAIDAGSTAVEVIVGDSGCKLIKVIDNGGGMTRDDLEIAPQRHATSKISKAEDLESINTLGFRGEALSSIAAVSLFSITSMSSSESTGWTLEIEGGVVKGIRQTARTVGTTVEVRNLFFNTPARLKFLKSKATEMFHIIRTVTELALAHPRVSFKLIKNKEEIINLDENTSIEDRIKMLLNAKAAKHLLKIKFNIAPVKIEGFISKAGVGQATRRNQYIFVNQRPVLDKTISHAIMQGYHTLLSEKQFPVVVLFIQTPPSSIDVNVHPTKREIRFKEANVLHDVIVSVIKEALRNKGDLPRLHDGAQQQKNNDYVSDNTYHVPQQKRDISPQPYAGKELDQELFSSSLQESSPAVPWQSSFKATAENQFGYLQVKNTYIISQDKEGIVIIDQHAAHERILFDGLLAQFKEKRVEKQRLLLPATIHLSKAHNVLMQENCTVFKDLGFDVEEFGEQTFAVQAYPAILGKVNPEAVLESIIAEIADIDLSSDMEKRITQFLASAACHSAIRANEKLSPEQIKALLERLWQTDVPYTCPHGRPTIIKLKWDEIEKRFKRR
ncbi:MAG: DNA mismatch repair endonuclease MutL [PVC group bacterium]|nr:DNA mismatch repair endonuclease MutL [PVC group bacterium]